MRIKFAVIVAVGLATGLVWFYFSVEAPRGLAGNEDTPEADTTRAFAAHKPSSEDSSRGRAATDRMADRKASRKASRRAARVQSQSRKTERARRRSETETKRPTVNAMDPTGDDVGQAVRGSENIAQTKQLLNMLRDASPRTPGADPIDPTDLGLRPEDVGPLDLNGDQKISQWELDRSQQILDRTEQFPIQNDLGDRAYPVDREDYRRSDSEFDGFDANADGLMDADEYYALLVQTEKANLRLDKDGNRSISPEESGLSPGDFAEIDRNSSGNLQKWEIRRALSLGALD